MVNIKTQKEQFNTISVLIIVLTILTYTHVLALVFQ